MESSLDIFISYAHIDDEPLIEDYPGWVTAFHRVLEKRLRQLLGEQPTIWRDPVLRGNELFDDEIADRFRDARLFISVVSPRYVKSDYCQKELREFLDAASARGGLRIGNLSRVIKVIKTPVDLAEQPEAIRPMLGYSFFQEDPDTRRARELAVYPPTYRDQFLLVLDDLAQEVTETLQSFAPTPDGADTAAAGEEPKAAGPVVYLASTTADVKEAHDRIRRELVESGVTVVPSQNLPTELGAFEELVRGELARSRLSVHVLGGRYAFSPEGTELSSGELQLSLAAERGAELPRLIWMPRDLEIEDPRQLELVERVRQDPAAQRNAQLLTTGIEELKSVIEETLHPPRPQAAAAATSPAAAPEGPVRLYLIYDSRDVDAVAPLEDLLWEVEDSAGEKRFEVSTRLLDGDETEVREDHEDNLRQCDAFLVYYGEGNERWLRQQLSELRKARGLRDGRPILAQGVVVAPPEGAAKARFRSNEAVVVRLAGEPSAEAFAELFSAIDESRAAAP